MIDSKSINEIVTGLLSALPTGLVNLPTDMEQNFRAVLQSAFAKMDLVTRAEFDVQVKVLARTREKLDQLEKTITALEEREQ